MSKLVNNPHDSFFKAIFSKKENVQAYLRHFLPSEVIKVIDFSSLTIENSSFIEETLKSYFSDIVYSVNLYENAGFIYILFEHKSYYSELVAFQLLKYIVNLLSSWLQQNKGAKRLPLVIPVVLYHGELDFKLENRFSALFNIKNKDLLKYMPDFEFILTDLSKKSDDELKKIEFINAALSLFKHIRDKNFINQLPDLLNLIRKNAPYFGSLFVYFEYIVSGAINTDPKKLLNTLQNRGGDIMPSLAQKLIDQGMQQGIQRGMQQGMQRGMQQGMQRGMQQGMQQGKIEALKETIGDMIEIKFSLKPDFIIEQIQKIDSLSELRALKEIIKKAKQLQEVENFLTK